MKIINGVALALVLLLAACSAMKADPQREAQADLVLKQVIAGDTAGLLAQSSPAIDRTTAPAQIAQIRSVLPKTAPPPGRSTSWTRQVGNGGEQYVLVREYKFPTHTIVNQTVMTRSGTGPWLVAGFYFNGATAEEMKAVEFSLSGKTPVHYAVFAGMVAAPLFMLVTVGFALFRRRWVWAVASLFAFMAFKLNWATGQWSFQPLAFNLLGAGFVKAGSSLAPWIMTVGLPVPAILFWAMGKNRPKPRKAKAEDAFNSPETSPHSD